MGTYSCRGAAVVVAVAAQTCALAVAEDATSHAHWVLPCRAACPSWALLG